jgi:hypothetical protein
LEAFWAINEPHNEEKEEEKKANGSVHSKRGENTRGRMRKSEI